MIKRTLTLLIASCITLVSCSKLEEKVDSNNDTASSQITYTNPTNTNIPITISDSTTSFTRYSNLGELLFLIDKDNNDKLTNIPSPKTSGYINSKDLIETFPHNVESLVVVDNDIYFTSISNNNSIYKLDYLKNEITKIKETNAYNLTYKNNKLYFINFDANKKLLSYDINSNTYNTVINDKVGKYIINGDFIFYQNLDDNSSLYSITLNGSNRTKITDFSVDSFATLQNQLYISNSSDNNSLYLFDTLTTTCKRIAIIDATNLKSTNNSLYFINSKSNTLHELIINKDNTTYSSSEILYHNVNEYFPSSNNLYLELSNNVNKTYVMTLE